jgi:hypothetical protein
MSRGSHWMAVTARALRSSCASAAGPRTCWRPKAFSHWKPEVGAFNFPVHDHEFTGASLQKGDGLYVCMRIGDGQAEAVADYLRGITVQDGIHAFTAVRTELDLRGVSRFVSALRSG